MKNRRNSGFTLIELMVVVAIAGIIAAIAVPSFSRMIERNKLKEAAESLKADLMFAKTEAIKRSTNLNVAIVVSAGSWCYGLSDDNSACACGTANDCGIKAVDGSQFKGTLIEVDDTIFDFRRGTALAMGATISTSNYSARVRVSNRGRVTICSPDSGRSIGGYSGC